MNGIHYLTIGPDGAITEACAATEEAFTNAVRETVGAADQVERVDVDVDLAMYHGRRAAPSAPVNLVAAVIVTAHWGRAPEQYTGTVVLAGGGPTGHESASLGVDAEKYVRGLADFACRRSSLPGNSSP